MKKAGFLVAGGMLLGSILTVALDNTIVNAQVIQSWSKDKVVAMLFVKPSFGAFVPAEGNSIGVTWTKDQVVPIVLVKPSIGGFVPVDGSSIGNVWLASAVRPLVFVKPYLGVFVPSISTEDSSQSVLPTPNSLPPSNAPRSAACNPAIETHIDGDFNGWDQETLYKMDDGSIWQQSSYHYHYHYTYHPSVTIYLSRSGACHIKVEGDDDDGADVVRIK